jgi:lantibiotic biosynthesis dehydratase-like protein
VTSIVRALAHMHVNRLVRSRPREHEAVIYDLLHRLHETRRHSSPISTFLA